MRVIQKGFLALNGSHSIAATRRDVLLCVGYLDVMSHFVELFREDGCVMSSAPVTEICGPFGIMRKQMAAWLNRSLSAAGDDADAGRKR